jgi:hypothetical protein
MRLSTVRARPLWFDYSTLPPALPTRPQGASRSRASTYNPLIYIDFYVPATSSICHLTNIGAVRARTTRGFSQSYPQKMCIAGKGS